jgi:hypothetical protein
MGQATEVSKIENLLNEFPQDQIGKRNAIELQEFVLRGQSIVKLIVAPTSPFAAHCDEAVKVMRVQVSKGDWLQARSVAAYELSAVLKGLKSAILKGEVESPVWTGAVSTCEDVLSQSGRLLQDGFRVAATVLAGGALETHLRRLCLRYSLQWTGDGSIQKYNDAIAQNRNNSGVAPYDQTIGKQITAWGGLRNDAAHDPTSFESKHAESTVDAMIRGIIDFLVLAK